jgi:isoleucyl-tRNA synthetase
MAFNANFVQANRRRNALRRGKPLLERRPMTDAPTKARDYSQTLFLPKTDFPMRAGLPQKEPVLLKRWQDIDLYGKLRAAAKGRPRFILHDGPPYANGNIHIGHALNKILKDVVTRSQQMLGFDSNYVPGWDCHGLPIEWKIEEENYRAKGKPKPDFSDAAALVEFRKECRQFAEHWIKVQRGEFERLGVTGDWSHPYTTMDFAAEAQIAREIMKFAANGTLYRGSKPVMWSVVEKTALAEAEVEYEDYVSDTVWVKFPVAISHAEKTTENRQLAGASIVIWTTTPWTIPGNRAISFSPKIEYGLYQIVDAPSDNWAKPRDLFVLADKLAVGVFRQARVTAFKRMRAVSADDLAHVVCQHPLKGFAGDYVFPVPLLAGDHVTDDTGTGFVHTAPGHGRDDFEVWIANFDRIQRIVAPKDTPGLMYRLTKGIPYTVDDDGRFTKDAPGFEGRQVITEKGEKGDANDAVIKALIDAGMLIARGRLKHQYPHSWRSKKPVIFRNTPQWFIAMDEPIVSPRQSLDKFRTTDRAFQADLENYISSELGKITEDTLRRRALAAINVTRWVPEQGKNRITGMVESRPDWVISRQRAWGVPIAIFINPITGEILKDEAVNVRIADAFEAEGADAWFADGAKERFLGGDRIESARWKKVDDILDVWFDSGSTHAFVLEDPEHFPALAHIKRKADGGPETVMYLEGSDQHRGWFQSSLLESCGARGRAPFDVVLTHGFVLDEAGYKMSKSLGNVTAPQDVIKDSGADILRMWVCAADYADDLRIGSEILKTTADTYRRLRNTLRWMLGNLAHFEAADKTAYEKMPELEGLMLHRLAELDPVVRQAYADFDYKRIFAALNAFMTVDLSAFYFDIRKDALYCDPYSSVTRKACLTVLDHLFRATVTWLAPMLCFTAEEAWLARDPSAVSVHLEQFPEVPPSWRDDALAERWRKLRNIRRVVTGALELERAAKRIGSSLEAAPIIYVDDAELFAAAVEADLAELCITSAATLVEGEGPNSAFRLDDVRGVAVEPLRAEGKKCARSWKISPAVGDDPQYPDVTPRDAQALREWDEIRKAAE